MKETCSMCGRRAESVSLDRTPNYVRTKSHGTLCTPCASALEQSGVEIKGFEPTPRRHQRKPRTPKATKARKEKKR